ncbi:MAG: hypothetical protein KME57_08710 [Scytonema hyalinum WJT4-NPBG1]|jgi:hypothetical protein|nr:hypothetical protein [Scytonema hyalinum WJT4-NPBG1]
MFVKPSFFRGKRRYASGVWALRNRTKAGVFYQSLTQYEFRALWQEFGFGLRYYRQPRYTPTPKAIRHLRKLVIRLRQSLRLCKRALLKLAS